MAAIKESVRRLIADHIESVSQLEVLLLLQRGEQERWTAGAVAARLRTSPELAEATLAKFAQAGLLGVDVDAAGEPGFVYRPPASLARAIDDVAAAYTTHKTTLIALIFSPPSDAMQDFADAFRLRSEDD